MEMTLETRIAQVANSIQNPALSPLIGGISIQVTHHSEQWTELFHALDVLGCVINKQKQP